VIDLEPEEMEPEFEVEGAVRSVLPPADQDPSDRPVLRETAADGPEYEWQSLPGYFGKPRRVRVRVR
jgi:hypothetical protein